MYKGSLFSPPSSLVAYGLFDGADYTLYTIEIESASFKTVKLQMSSFYCVCIYAWWKLFWEVPNYRKKGRERGASLVAQW